MQYFFYDVQTLSYRWLRIIPFSKAFIRQVKTLQVSKKMLILTTFKPTRVFNPLHLKSYDTKAMASHTWEDAEKNNFHLYVEKFSRKIEPFCWAPQAI